MLMLMAIPSPFLTVPIVHAEEKVWTQEMVKELALEQAKKWGLHKKRYVKTLECENNFNAKGQSEHKDPTGPNGREDSWGSVQIHLPSHPTITREMAESPDFAIPWMAEQWSLGNASLWSCWRVLSGDTKSK